MIGAVTDITVEAPLLESIFVLGTYVFWALVVLAGAVAAFRWRRRQAVGEQSRLGSVGRVENGEGMPWVAPGDAGDVYGAGGTRVAWFVLLCVVDVTGIVAAIVYFRRFRGDATARLLGIVAYVASRLLNIAGIAAFVVVGRR